MKALKPHPCAITYAGETCQVLWSYKGRKLFFKSLQILNRRQERSTKSCNKKQCLQSINLCIRHGGLYVKIFNSVIPIILCLRCYYSPYFLDDRIHEGLRKLLQQVVELEFHLCLISELKCQSMVEPFEQQQRNIVQLWKAVCPKKTRRDTIFLGVKINCSDCGGRFDCVAWNV